ncbi:MAG: DUF4134 domain-containing protein [Bacteroidota bacterium]|nr:DUF4134 domain-containing protein [Bacteroidota bacterium]
MIVYHFLDVMPTGSLSDINWSVKHEIWFGVKLLCYAIAAVLGLVSGLRVYNIWNVNGRHHVHIDAQVISWVAAAIFLVLATAFINMTLM